jgi:hypothetical protein
LAFGVLLLAAFGLAVTTTAGKPAKPPQDIPVTVTITDDGYAIQSDGDGAYINGVTGVTAVIVPLGNLQLKTGDTRMFSLYFGGIADCPEEGCTPPFTGPEQRHGYMTTSCPIALPSMGNGAQQLCNLNVHFTANGLGWFIRFGQSDGTTPATVTRGGDGSWTIDVAENGVALLESYPLKGRVTYTPHGHFHMPVSLAVTQP